MQFLHAKKLPLTTQLIGVDGGASEVKACEVDAVELAGRFVLRRTSRRAARVYPVVPGFQTPAERGVLGEEVLGAIEPAEREHGWAWIEATAACVLEIARSRGARHVLLGICMPGRKTEDGRGIAFALNGPRIPEFAACLERTLAVEGVELAMPIDALQSDGWCAGLGEEWSEEGLFHSVSDAYYLGGGTGVAEALKLRGALVPLESISQILPKAFTLRGAGGLSFESLVSAGGINRHYAQTRGFELPLEPKLYPELRAKHDECAADALRRAGDALGELIALRVLALLAQPDDDPLFPGPIRLDRVVVGQRLAQLLHDARTHEYLDAHFRSALFSSLHRAPAFREHYDEMALQLSLEPAERAATRDGLIVLSHQRSAPAIGAAAHAWLEWGRSHA